ncbi:hypothetical protein Slin14017_G124280 [Septoria linicola]|nr:hypothetical protein Slin14017_G124280 [Septoria linicola]
MALTISEAAALINVATILVKLSYPLLFALIAVGTLRTETNAATWSVFGRLINHSLWPAILQTHAASSSKVQRRTSALSWLSSIAGLMLAVSAAITPLGLYTRDGSKQLEDVTFEYVKDTVSAIDRATPSREAYKMNRVCLGGRIPCPGSSGRPDDSFQGDGLGFAQDYQVSSDIVANITDIFGGDPNVGSGTIAGSMGIEWRSYINDNDSPLVDEGQPRTTADFRYLQDFKLSNTIHAIEGLLVSSRDDIGLGIAFRNHTFPVRSQSTYTWTEDLLWLEPVTSCTNFNVTFDYKVPGRRDLNSSSDARVIDAGGFVNYPRGQSVPEINDTQNDPQLLERSRIMAALTNGVLMRVLNETQNATALGKEYLLPEATTGFGSALRLRPDEIALSSFGSSRAEPAYNDPGLPGTLTFRDTDELNLTAGRIVPLERSIASLLNTLDIGVSGTAGGTLLGAAVGMDEAGNPISQDRQSSSRLATESRSSQPLYACLTTVKASIKTVSFEHSGIGGTENLVIRDVVLSNQTHQRGMEDNKRNISSMDAFWGIIPPDADLTNVATLDRPFFYLPESRSSNNPAGGSWGPYSGGTDVELSEKWSRLSRDTSTAGKIIDTIWTDGIANSLVGTQSPLNQADGTGLASYTRSVTQHEQVVSYRWRYAIPALMFAACYIVLFGHALLLFCRKRINLSFLRVMLDQTSAGRAMTTERYGAKDHIDFAKTRDWVEVRGDEVVQSSSGSRNDMQESHHGESLLANR